MKNFCFKIVLLTGLVVALTGCGSAGPIQAEGAQTESDTPIQTTTGGQPEVDNPSSKTVLPTQEPQKDSSQMTQPAQPTPSPDPEANAQADPATDQPTGESEKESTQLDQPAPSTCMGFLVEKAREELSQRLSIAISQISLVEAREVVWPDSSLGCPQPGMKYQQVPEDGALIVLQAQGSVYEYHIGGSRGLFLCEKVLSKPEKPPQIDLINPTPTSQIDLTDPTPTPPIFTSPSTPDNSIPPSEDQ